MSNDAKKKFFISIFLFSSIILLITSPCSVNSIENPFFFGLRRDRFLRGMVVGYLVSQRARIAVVPQAAGCNGG